MLSGVLRRQVQRSDASFDDIIGDMMELPDSGRVQCLLCGKDYVSKRKAKVHIMTIHKAPNDPSYQSKCEVCGKVFKHVINMRDHLSRVHKVKKQLQGVY